MGKQIDTGKIGEKILESCRENSDVLDMERGKRREELLRPARTFRS